MSVPTRYNTSFQYGEYTCNANNASEIIGFFRAQACNNNTDTWVESTANNFTSPTTDGRYITLKFTNPAAADLGVDQIDAQNNSAGGRRFAISTTASSRISMTTGPCHWGIYVQDPGVTAANKELVHGGMVDISPYNQNAFYPYCWISGTRILSSNSSTNANISMASSCIDGPRRRYMGTPQIALQDFSKHFTPVDLLYYNNAVPGAWLYWGRAYQHMTINYIRPDQQTYTIPIAAGVYGTFRVVGRFYGMVAVGGGDQRSLLVRIE
jgi:hypothetical protein